MDSQIDKKNIVLCADGTGQSGGVGSNTNVWRIYDAIDIKHPKVKQLTFYDNGVGTNKNILMKTMGLVFGFGLSKNIRELYKYAVMHYKKGDNLYLFGFSRGSHTIRLLAELICTFGLLNPKSFDNEKELDKAINALQKQFKSAIRLAWWKNIFTSSSTDKEAKRRKLTESKLSIKRKKYEKNLHALIQKQTTNKHKDSHDTQENIHKDVKIQFIGVWDTVSAVGMPIEEMRNSLLFAHHAFVDHKLNRLVQRACHALAIDEKRHTFKPELWDQTDAIDQQRIEQVWFSGVHTNVGGGYRKDQLAHVSLEWMMNQAHEKGLLFRESRKKEFSQQGNYNGTMYDSRSGLAAFYRYKPRNIQELTDKFYPNKPDGPNIHVSVYQRIQDSSDNYSPVNLPINPCIASNSYDAQDVYQDKAIQSQQYCINNMLENKASVKSPQSTKSQSTRSKDNPWNIIWWQKILHLAFISYFIAFVVVGMQLTKLNSEILVTSDQTTIKAVQKILVVVNDANPLYITNKILPGYANHWETFLLMFIAFGLLMLCRNTLNKHLNNIGNILWNHPPFDKNRVNAKRLKVGMLLKLCLMIAGFFTAKGLLNENIILSFKTKILPIIVSLFFLGVIVFMVLYFIIPESWFIMIYNINL
ncbi:MAG: DUF2235 domain-containing protein [Proteobacteria bacterium]|nr:DUF2235 domain-containing protein [Pseudomonadota bacterium]